MHRVCAILLLAAAPVFPAGLAGFWEFTVDLGGIEIEAKCKLAENGAKLTGRCWSQAAPFRYDVEASGTVRGERFDLTYSFPADHGNITFRFAGETSPEQSLSGDFTLTQADGSASRGIFDAARSR